MSKFEGKRALVTGAAGGIGRAIVASLKDNGAVVAGCDRVGSDIVADMAFEGDLTEAGFVEQLVQNAREALGGLDILVNNAGLMRRGTITEATDDDLRMSLAVNVEAPFRLCRSAIPVMAAAGGGAIVNIASCWGKYPGPDHAVYCMTKAALASLTQCTGRDHAHQGIRINAVCPNEVDTPMLRTGFETRGLDPASAVRDLDRSVPLGRIAQPEDIADVVCFLASSAARYMCGALVEVNGGKPVY
ncbi:MAG: SDR family oxidoreductase [Alphaproteobacteria bacterium]|nr:SDR family oxidoreductase [Alphaproteobacteria bacterium]